MVSMLACNEPQKEESPMKGFKKGSIQELKLSVPNLFGSDWSLVTAGVDTSFNTMTANWGGMGYLWEKDVAFIFIRPQRYTLEFIEREDGFTLSFFDHAKYEDALKIMGSKSGRTSNKIKESGLTPIATPTGKMAYAEAKMIVECRKLYGAPLQDVGFIDSTILHTNYAKSDFHKMFVAEIVNVWIK